MADYRRDVHDTRDRTDTTREHHSPVVPAREVTKEAVAAARSAGMEAAHATTKNYFGSPQLHDGNGNALTGGAGETRDSSRSADLRAAAQDSGRSRAENPKDGEKPGEPKPESGRAKTPADGPKDPPKGYNPAPDAPKSEPPKSDAPKSDAPKTEAPKSDSPKPDSPKSDSPKSDAPTAPTTPTERHDGPADKGDREADRANRIESRKILDRIMTREKGVSEKFYNNLKDSLSGLPARDLAELEKAGIKIRAVSHIRNGAPGEFDGRTLKLSESGESSFADGSGGRIKDSDVARNETAAHEIGHALSHVRGIKKRLPQQEHSQDPEFQKALEADRRRGWQAPKTGDPGRDREAREFYKYHRNVPDEAYAQTYAMESGLASPEHQRLHRQQFPKLSEWMRRQNQGQ